MKKILSFLIFIITLILIPNGVYATNIDSVLTDGKLVIPSIPFTGNLAYDAIASYFYDDLKIEDLYIEYNSCNEDFTQCSISNGDNSRQVEIVWKYDPKIKKIVDEIAKKYPEDATKYIVDDIGILNMHINGGSVIENSLEFKKNISYKNFYIDVRGGGGPELTDSQIGILKFKLDGTIYWRGQIDPQFISQDLVYVSEDTNNIEESLQTRLQKLFPDHTFVVEKTDITTQSIIDSYLDEARDIYNNDAYVQQEYPNIDDFLAMHDDYNFLDGALEYLYDICVDDAMGFQVAVKKDSKKAVNKVEVITNDVLTNISIATIGDAILPLDTKIQVNKLTSGAEYENIMSKIVVKNSETYDLKLYSKQLNKYITKLDNGKFQVKIPISEELKGKDLAIYYVNQDDKVEKYDVTITEDGYASFITDHFSIYTLADITKNTSNNVANPETLDNISTSICLFVLCMLCLFSVIIYKKRLN